MSKTYSEKLKDPRWQKKRLEIMERDDFTCQSCGCDDKSLHVHHKYYLFGLEPWEHSNNSLITLCEECHKKWDEDREIVKDFTKVLLYRGWQPKHLWVLLDMLIKYDKDVPCDLILNKANKAINTLGK